MRLDGFRDHVAHQNRLEVEFHFARLHFRQIENVVDQREQMARARLNDAQLLLLLARDRAGQFHQQRSRKADDGVERRTQFVAHACEEAVLREVGVFQGEIFLAQLLFETLARRDVADGARDHRLRAVLDRAEADLYRKLRTVLAHAEQLEIGAHRPHARILGELPAVLDVGIHQATGDERLHGLTDQLLGPIAKELYGLRVHEHDAAVRIYHHHGIGSGLQEAPERLFGVFGHEGVVGHSPPFPAGAPRCLSERVFV